MNFWQFLDNQLERLERNGFGCAVFTFLFFLFIGLPIIAAIANHFQR